MESIGIRLHREFNCTPVRIVVRKLDDEEANKRVYSPEDLEALRMVICLFMKFVAL